MTKLDKAIIFATKAHAGQVDKNGDPYILHPLAVAQIVRNRVGVVKFDWVVEEYMITALLHDTVEDTKVTQNEIYFEFGNRIGWAVAFLTRPAGVPYFDYIRNCKGNLMATTVKAADLQHNLDPYRLSYLRESKQKNSLIARYEKALAIIRGEEP